jgi:membrane protease YdiL (CAAX protease family)
VFIANIPSLGEELGWRGYLLTRLVEAKIPAPLWVSGLIWGAWHLPLILWGDYATSSRPWLSATLFMIVVTLAGVFFGWLRLAGGSVWPAMLAHSSHNVAYQSIFDAHMNGPLERTFAGEQGLFSIVAYGAAVAWLWRSGRLARVLERPVLAARPKDEPPATLPSAGEAPWQRES